MPWVCSVCGKAPENQPPKGAKGHGPLCFTTPECKGKGKFACNWVAPVREVVITCDEHGARRLGYGIRVNTRGAKFPNQHSTDYVFQNAAGTHAISPDGSTHSGDRDGWKGFVVNAGGYRYMGCFQPDLDPWVHRPNHLFAGSFPRG